MRRDATVAERLQDGSRLKFTDQWQSVCGNRIFEDLIQIDPVTSYVSRNHGLFSATYQIGDSLNWECGSLKKESARVIEVSKNGYARIQFNFSAAEAWCGGWYKR